MADLAVAGREGRRCLELDLAAGAQGTPKEIVDKLQAEVVKILNLQDVKDRFAGGGVETIPSTSAELDARVKKTTQQLAVIVEKAKIKPD